jgi:hypothetical protein
LQDEQAQKQELQLVIKKEQDYLRTTLQEKLQQIRAEQTALRREGQSEEEQRVKGMESVILRLIQEKDQIEEKLIKEVNHKQRIVLTLE